MATTMYSNSFPPVQVGKAILAKNRLTLNGAPYDLHDQDGFATFVLTTGAIIGTALAIVFPADTGELVFENGDAGIFKVGGSEPWQQYNQAVLGFRSTPELAKVITAWCALLDLYSHLSPSAFVEPDAIAIARYIASEGFKAAHGSAEAVRKWFEYKAFTSTPAGFIAKMEGKVEEPADPWGSAHDLELPAVAALGEFSALAIIEATCGDIVVKNGIAWANAGARHFIQCIDDVSHIERREGQFMATLKCGGVDRSFRVHADGDSMVLRLQMGVLPKMLPIDQ